MALTSSESEKSESDDEFVASSDVLKFYIENRNYTEKRELYI